MSQIQKVLSKFLSLWQRFLYFFLFFFYLFFFTFLLMRGERIQIALKRAIIGPPVKRHLNVRWRANDGPTLNASLVDANFSGGPRTSIARKPYNFMIFQVGSLFPPPPLYPPMCNKHGCAG